VEHPTLGNADLVAALDPTIELRDASFAEVDDESLEEVMLEHAH